MTRAVLIIGHGTRDGAGAAEFLRFAREVAAHWPDRRVEPCFLELADPPVLPALEAVIAGGARDIVVAPAFLLGAGHIKNDLPAAIDVTRARFPGVTIRYSAPLGVEPRVLRVLDERIAAVGASAVPPEDTAILLVGRGTSDPDANADLYKLGRLLWEGGPWWNVECAFCGLARPSLPEGLARCAALGARRIVVAPLFLFTGVLVERIRQQVREQAARYPDVELAVASHLGGNPLLGELLAQRVREAEVGRVTMGCDTCVYRAPLVGFEDRAGAPRFSDSSHGLRGHSHGSVHRTGPVPDEQAAPMAAAPLRFATDGRVDWGNMWATFCALPQDGGPPHRGADAFLGAREDADTASVGYRFAVAEIIRGVGAVSGLGAYAATPGWIAVRCTSPRMARWLGEAIGRENVQARADGTTVFIPAGDDFRLAGEIKSVITAVAKTTHYWREHLAAVIDGAKVRATAP
ncbi:MAG: sirohydrochlorin chelatase [Chloroflexota bacterium]|nr:sirohydrochlorin chelatase [Chloroflexota bacterium]